jgi:hypothetical protein
VVQISHCISVTRRSCTTPPAAQSGIIPARDLVIIEESDISFGGSLLSLARGQARKRGEKQMDLIQMKKRARKGEHSRSKKQKREK